MCRTTIKSSPTRESKTSPAETNAALVLETIIVFLTNNILAEAEFYWLIPWSAFCSLCSANTACPFLPMLQFLTLFKGGGGTVLWTEDNFVFGQIWKFRFMYTFGIYWSFGIFYPTFDEQQSRFRVQSSQKIAIKNRKNEKMPKNSQFWTCFGVFE